MAVVNAELLAEGRSDRKRKQLYRRSKRIIVGKHVLVAPLLAVLEVTLPVCRYELQTPRTPSRVSIRGRIAHESQCALT
jgi:hypothetical protein